MYLILWVVLVVAFAVLEGLTVGLISLWFSIGSLAGLIAAALGASVVTQVIAFSIVSGVCILLLRPVTRKYLVKKTEKTNADRIIDAEAVVTEPISNLKGTGRVRVRGESWTARSDDGEEFSEDAQVRVLRIEGVKAIVTRMN
jgi:membrane protein implicated in regulation of membrane protease activity